MNLLQMGLELMKQYEAELRENSTVESADLRLATYAIESAFSHCARLTETPASTHHLMVHGVITALAELRASIAEFDSSTLKRSIVCMNVAMVNASLSNFLGRQQQNVSCSGISSGETLRISREILNRLRFKTGLTSE